MRRIGWGVAAGAVLALAAATGVSAYWQAQQPIPIETVASGDLSVSASWADGTPQWAPKYPGDFVEATIAVKVVGVGDTLKWQVTATSDNNGAFVDEIWGGPCDSKTALPATNSPESLDICIRYTLPVGTPNDKQGNSFSPTITVKAEQVSG